METSKWAGNWTKISSKPPFFNLNGYIFQLRWDGRSTPGEAEQVGGACREDGPYTHKTERFASLCALIIRIQAMFLGGNSNGGGL